MTRKEIIINQLHQKIAKRQHLIGVAAGSGLTAKYAELGGADMIFALNSGRFRQMGVSSLAGFLPFVNSNRFVFDFATKEILPVLQKTPLIFGLCATDPTIDLETYIKMLRGEGFSGINNYPTVGLIDGVFRNELEMQGVTYDQEVAAIRLANSYGLFTVAFVFSIQQAKQMIQAGADVICVHLGLTRGGLLGAKRFYSLQQAKRMATQIIDICPTKTITMIYGGPINKPVYLQFMYDRTAIDGYIGGSVFERIPAEQTLLQVMGSYKHLSDYHDKQSISEIFSGIDSKEDYVSYAIKYISDHYRESISLKKLANILNLSRSYLSTVFKKQIGISFSDYLIDFRLDRAIEIMHRRKMPVNKVAEAVGYPNYYQFSKIFKKRKGMAPNDFMKTHQKTK
jgi:predicted TIM-barrel enzyme/AraC-like DNA-binding protein